MVGAPDPSVQNTKALDEFGSAARPERRQPVRHRRRRPRRLQPRRLRDARVADGRLPGDGIALLLGVIAGLYAGYHRGWVDSLAVARARRDPRLPGAAVRDRRRIGVQAAEGCAGGLIKPGISTVVFVIVIPTFPYFARHRARPGAVAARARVRRGRAVARRLEQPRIMFREILPNLVAPLIVYGDADHPGEHPVRGVAVVPRRGHLRSPTRAGAR